MLFDTFLVKNTDTLLKFFTLNGKQIKRTWTEMERRLSFLIKMKYYRYLTEQVLVFNTYKYRILQNTKVNFIQSRINKKVLILFLDNGKIY